MLTQCLEVLSLDKHGDVNPSYSWAYYPPGFPRLRHLYAGISADELRWSQAEEFREPTDATLGTYASRGWGRAFGGVAPGAAVLKLVRSAAADELAQHGKLATALTAAEAQVDEAKTWARARLLFVATEHPEPDALLLAAEAVSMAIDSLREKRNELRKLERNLKAIGKGR